MSTGNFEHPVIPDRIDALPAYMADRARTAHRINEEINQAIVGSRQYDTLASLAASQGGAEPEKWSPERVTLVEYARLSSAGLRSRIEELREQNYVYPKETVVGYLLGEMFEGTLITASILDGEPRIVKAVRDENGDYVDDGTRVSEATGMLNPIHTLESRHLFLDAKEGVWRKDIRYQIPLYDETFETIVKLK